MQAGGARRKFFIRTEVLLMAIFLFLAAIAGITFASSEAQAATDELNLLCWVGYEERSMLEPFEKKYNVHVKYKTYVGADQMYALLLSSKHQYDAVVVDPEYLAKLYKAGRLAQLDPADYNFSDYFPPFRKFALCWPDGKLYAILVRFGCNGIVYNSKRLSADDVKSYDVLWSSKVKGKVGAWDWYLPSMGTISCALGHGHAPTNLSNSQFEGLRKRLMQLRPQVAAIFASPAELCTALASEQVWIVPGAGEFMANSLRKQGKPIDWTIPDEGGQMWVETLAIPDDAPHPKLAKLYIQWMQTPEAQKLLSERQAYSSNVPNRKAYDLMTPAMKDSLHVHNEAEAMRLINKLTMRRLPQQQSELEWQDVWQKFKAASP